MVSHVCLVIALGLVSALIPGQAVLIFTDSHEVDKEKAIAYMIVPTFLLGASAVAHYIGW